MEGSGIEEENPRKRAQRVQFTCLPCRQSKLKCNRESPVCDQCYQRCRESSCIYSEKGLRYNAARQKTESMRDKIDRLELFVNRIKYGAEPTASPSQPQAKSDSTLTVDVEDISPLIGNLRLSETGATQYVVPGHWESIMEDIADVKAYFQSESAPAQSNSGDNEYSSSVLSIDITFGVSPVYSKADLLSFVPPKVEIDRYVSTWFNAPDHLSVILHAPTFRAQYQQFWHRPQSVSLGWLALLLSVSSAGAEISSQTFNDSVLAMRAENLRRLTSHALVLADYMSAQPFVIEAILFQVKCLLFKHQDTTRAIWQLHGQVMRLCWLAGYHRDPGNNPAISPFDCEMRRRLWMIALDYDILCCQQIGMTSLIHQNMLDTMVAANLTDDDFSMTHMQPPRPADEYTPTLVAIQYSKIVRVMGEIAKTIGGTTFPARADIEKQHSQIVSAHSELPIALQFAPLDQSFTDPPELILDRFRLEIMHKKAFCVLYRPFVGRAEYEREQTLCFTASEEVVRLTVSIVESCEPGCQFAGFRVYIRRHVHDFNLAAMLLCSGLKNDAMPNDTAWNARVRALLLQACGLWSLSGVTSPKARHCVTAIEKFLLQNTLISRLEPSLNHTPALERDRGCIGAETGVTLPQGIIGSQNALLASPQSLNDPSIEDIPEVFNIVQDPLFQQLFGPEVFLPGDYDPLWSG